MEIAERLTMPGRSPKVSGVRATVGVVWAALAVSAAACGGGGASQGSAGVAGTGHDTVAPSSTTATVRERTVGVDKSFWFAGFRVTVKTAALGNGQGQYGGQPSPAVSITANFENTGADRKHFDAELTLQSAGRNHFDIGEGQDLPEVPGGANQDGRIVILVDPSFKFDDAVMVVGKADTNQAQVPLGKVGSLVALEPETVPITGTVSSDPFDITLRGGELRADDPHYYREIEPGRRALKINYTAGPTQCPVITYDLSLVLPDGTTTGGTDSGEAGKADNFSVFVVSDHPAGAYTLKLTGEVKGSTGPGCPANFSAQAPFTIA
jgi:hypothetical protein